MNGAGNDFMVVDARTLTLDYEKAAVELCKLTHADGFMAVGNSDRADFRLHFYNSDGSRGEMCGNGARCICRFAHDNGITGETMTVETDAGLVPGRRLSETQYRVRLNTPGVLDLNRTAEAAYVELGAPGVPHAVAELPALSWDDRDALRERARALRFHPAFPKGANVNFFQFLAEDTVRILTYERGVEDYTLACGTGCGSVTAALFAAGRLPGGHLTLCNPGGVLTVSVTGADGRVDSVVLEGPTEVTGVYDIDPTVLGR